MGSPMIVLALDISQLLLCRFKMYFVYKIDSKRILKPTRMKQIPEMSSAQFSKNLPNNLPKNMARTDKANVTTPMIPKTSIASGIG